MKNTLLVTIYLLLVSLLLVTACTLSATTPLPPTPSLSATDIPPTNPPAATIALTRTPSATPSHTPESTFTSTLSPTSTQSSPTPTLPLTPYFFRIENIYQDDLLWQECVVSNDLYRDWSVGYKCFGTSLSSVEEDRTGLGIWVDRDDRFQDLRLEVNEASYETTHQNNTYRLFKDGELLLETEFNTAGYNPQRSLQYIDGEIIWELADDQQQIIFQGQSNLNQDRNLEAAYYPYGIADQLLFIGRRESRYQLYYNNQPIGGAFDDISLGYCCAPAYYTVKRTAGQYWFWGTREGRFYLVLITETK